MTQDGRTCVLIVDDDRSNAESLQKIFAREDMSVLVSSNAKSALELLRQTHVDVICTDLMMPGTTGIELLRAAKQVSADVEVVLMTAYGTVETAVAAMRDGAYDFVEKPLKRHSIIKSVKKAAERGRLVAENQSLKEELRVLKGRPMVGSSLAWRRVVDVASQAAPSVASVLLLGESGSGKEMLAKFIHESSGRKGAFVSVNCGAIPHAILESELFGGDLHAPQSSGKEGAFAKAERGTLFLDEISELPMQVQVKLLRVLQEGEYESAVGAPVKTDVRIIAATQRDLPSEIREGRLREDLHYRLNVIPLALPPLRARRDDIPLLVDHFMSVYCTKNARPRISVSPAAMERFYAYTWPGNVRELENVLERAVVLARGAELTEHDLPDAVRRHEGEKTEPVSFAVGTPLAEIELSVIRETLRHTRGDKTLAAQLLGISTRTVYRKLDGRDLGDSASD